MRKRGRGALDAGRQARAQFPPETAPRQSAESRACSPGCRCRPDGRHLGSLGPAPGPDKRAFPVSVPLPVSRPPVDPGERASLGSLIGANPTPVTRSVRSFLSSLSLPGLMWWWQIPWAWAAARPRAAWIKQLDRQIGLHWPALAHDLAEVATRDIIHHDEGNTSVQARIERCHEVRVIELSDRLEVPANPHHRVLVACERGRQDLEGADASELGGGGP